MDSGATPPPDDQRIVDETRGLASDTTAKKETGKASAAKPKDSGAASKQDAVDVAAAAEFVATDDWRWGLWSPTDRTWYDLVREHWRTAAAAEERATAVIPLKVHQIWLGPRHIPERCKALMATWSEMHPAWEHRLWTDADVEEAGLPPALAQAFTKAENPAEKSDILRLWLVSQHGGLYVDVDFECLRPFDGFHRRYSFFTGVSNVGAFELNNGLFAACPGHPVMRFLCDHVARPWAEWGADDVDPREAVAYQLELSGMLGAGLAPPPGRAAFLATTGPGFFTRAVMRSVTSSALDLEPSAVVSAAAPAAMVDGELSEYPIAMGPAPMAICPPDLFYPLRNSLRDLPHEER
eukprot:CAMPEP_0117511390 /NCGR_PEP_ID=MMETSP0784-20121206/28483_1 /TAXON_ID=39447 /ORGANISM="" /LENGTH=351 /DNA_ID=CAMNT_0005307061 /DNA_START=60 /DNA_END=1111 /DNA_ORIENTATION=+